MEYISEECLLRHRLFSVSSMARTPHAKTKNRTKNTSLPIEQEVFSRIRTRKVQSTSEACSE